MGLYARHRIDLQRGDLAFALGASADLRGAGPMEDRLLALWAPRGGGFLGLSVRSVFDALLSALAFLPGTELICSAVTIPDMAEVARAHGLRLVPVDVDEDTLAPRPDLLERALTPRTGAVLVAHLYGGRMDLDAVVTFCRRHGLPLIEDCAQGFTGLRGTDAAGSPEALASLFSFGPIKTATALGGALCTVRDGAVRARMRPIQEAWPRQSRTSFARRVARFGALCSLQGERGYGGFHECLGAVGVNTEAFVSRVVKSFPVGRAAMLAGVRRRPSAPLVALLERRVTAFDEVRLARRAAHGERVHDALCRLVGLPGRAQPRRTHWLLPIVVPEPAALVNALRLAGFDAAQGTTSLATIAPDVGTPLPPPERAARMLAQTVYLPAYPDLPDAALARMVDEVCRLAAEHGWRAVG
jgi:perosamine synthetase